MEAGLKKLEAQEKYSVELDKALAEYANLKSQAADIDPVELYQARQVIRPAQEKAAERQLEETLPKKPSFSLLLSAKQSDMNQSANTIRCVYWLTRSFSKKRDVSNIELIRPSF